MEKFGRFGKPIWPLIDYFLRNEISNFFGEKMKSNLLESNKLCNLQLKNRILMAPIKTGFGNAKGEITQRHIDFYVRRAEGGVALIIPEPMFVHISGKELPIQIPIGQ